MMMSDEVSEPALRYDALKAKQRELREGFTTELTLRVHRALSWYGRASDEREGDGERGERGRAMR